MSLFLSLETNFTQGAKILMIKKMLHDQIILMVDELSSFVVAK
jgi:hypothetical protein